MRFFDELKRRNVFRVAGVYAVVGWLLIQVIVAVFPTFGAPAWVLKVFIALIIGGFPIALVLAWAFEVTPDGVKLAKSLAEGESAGTKSNRLLDYVILAGFALIAGMIVWQAMRPAAHVAKASVSAQAATAPSNASIAVLPFVDLSPAGDQEYFSEGIAEEILNVLANVSGLQVASRTSSFQFKGQENIGVPVIAEQLHVRHILEGSVRKAGDTIRITAQLIDAETDKHLWSETFDHTLTTENIFAVQDEITKAIVDQLSSRMGGAGNIVAPAARAADTENTDAYALFLEGQSRFVQRGAENILLSTRSLERAVEIDPEFARAWAVLSAAYLVSRGWLNGADLNRDFSALSEQAARKAITLDRTLALPYAVLAGASKDRDYDYEAMFAYFDEAVARNPRDETIYSWRGDEWRSLGYFDKAIADFDQCLAINPDYGNCREGKGNSLIMSGEVDAGLAILKENMRRGFDGGANFALLDAYVERRDDAALLYEVNETARDLGRGDLRWAVDMMYQALTEPDYDRPAALRLLEARLHSMGSKLVGDSSIGANVLLIFGAYDRAYVLNDSWWWSTASFPEWKASPERKRQMRAAKLDVYWRKHGFPPRCRPVGDDDFECE